MELWSKEEKCTFLGESVKYLGHRVDKHGLHTVPEKVRAIVEAPHPKTVQELGLFLGLLNYYNKFIPNLASLIHPLNKLLKYGVKWEWSGSCVTAIEMAKKCLISSPLLVHFNSKLPITLTTDASSYVLGWAVLSHVLPHGIEQPIAFASRTLSCSEVNYSQMEKKALAIIFGVCKFHQYLYGKPFVLVTDHKPLTTLLGPKTSVPTLAASRMQRWALVLSTYSYTIEYRPTAQHTNACRCLVEASSTTHCCKREERCEFTIKLGEDGSSTSNSCATEKGYSERPSTVQGTTNRAGRMV